MIAFCQLQLPSLLVTDVQKLFTKLPLQMSICSLRLVHTDLLSALLCAGEAGVDLKCVCCRYSFPAEFGEALDHAMSAGKGTKILLRFAESDQRPEFNQPENNS